MTYGRMRHRSHLEWRPEPGSEAVYPPPGVGGPLAGTDGLIGDLNRMERDYLNPAYPEPPWATRPEGSDPSAECAAATGVDVETVRAVLAYVFRESR